MKNISLTVSVKGVSTVVAVSIILAAVVTASFAIQTFVVPELERERAFLHSQDILISFEELYSKGRCVIPLSHSGVPFFLSTSSTGQVRYDPQIGITLGAFNVTELMKVEKQLNSQDEFEVKNISEAYFLCQNASDSLKINCTFFRDTEKVTFLITSELLNRNNNVTLVRFQLRVIQNSTFDVYNYTVVQGDSFSLNFMNPIYNVTSFIKESSKVYYKTNSPNCFLILKYFVTKHKNTIFFVRGAVIYESSGFPLSYAATPWGLTALEAGNSSLATFPKILWVDNTLTVNLYNFTWNMGTIGGTGTVSLHLLTSSFISLKSSFSRLYLNFTSASPSLKNSYLQLANILKSSKPENVKVSVQQGDSWVMVSFEGKGNLDLVISNVKAVLG